MKDGSLRKTSSKDQVIPEYRFDSALRKVSFGLCLVKSAIVTGSAISLFSLAFRESRLSVLSRVGYASFGVAIIYFVAKDLGINSYVSNFAKNTLRNISEKY